MWPRKFGQNMVFLVIWESLKNLSGPQKKRSANFFLKIRPSQENPRSVPAQLCIIFENYFYIKNAFRTNALINFDLKFFNAGFFVMLAT